MIKLQTPETLEDYLDDKVRLNYIEKLKESITVLQELGYNEEDVEEDILLGICTLEEVEIWQSQINFAEDAIKALQDVSIEIPFESSDEKELTGDTIKDFWFDILNGDYEDAKGPVYPHQKPNQVKQAKKIQAQRNGMIYNS
jgi:hypothetical protein